MFCFDEKLSVLIVENDSVVRNIHQKMVAKRSRHIAIYTADNGRSGLELFQQHTPDITITDIAMPIMDGICMAAEIKSFKPNAVIAAVSAYTDSKDLLRAIEIGIDHYLVKPLSLKKLFELIDRGISLKNEISDRKRFEESLRLSEERFKQLFDQSNDAIIILNQTDYSILDCNGEAEKVFGYCCEELVGTDFFALVVDPDRSLTETVGAADNSAGQIERMPMLKKDGSQLLVSVRFKQIALNASKVLYCSFRDITDRIRIEAEALTAQASLIQADKMASLGLLVSGMAHEINNPNNCILFNSELLARTWTSTMPILEDFYRHNGDFKLGSFKFSETRDVVPKLFSGLVDGAERIRSIVDMLKDFARQDRSDTLAPFDLNKVITNAIAIVNHEIKKCCHYFYLEAGADVPAAFGNAQQIEQVMINLIMNSLQSLRDVNCAIRVTTAWAQEDGHIVITVADEGEGMSDEVLRHLTEPFFTTKSEKGGTGLGLSITESILKKNRGAISFVSSPGKGTTARVELRPFQG